MKYRIHIKADCDAEIKEELREVAEILVGLREATKIWNDNYRESTKARIEKEKWEQRADTWINKHKILYDDPRRN